MNAQPPIETFQEAEIATDAVISRLRFKVITFDDAIHAEKNYSWILYRLIPEEALVALVSPPKYAKSFLALDWSFHVAGGMNWGDVEVEGQGGVVYIAGEGENGFTKRIQAWHQEFGHPGSIPFAAIPDRVNLMDTQNTVPALIEDVEKIKRGFAFPLRMIVVDTVARSMIGGEENSNKDMGLFVDAVDKLRKHFRVTVLLVHHMGKDRAKGMRGGTALPGAVDTIIELSRDETRMLTATVTEQKDEESGVKYPFRLRRVVLGQDDRGRDVSSCVVVRSDEEVQAAKKVGPQLKGDQKNAMTALTQALLNHGTYPAVQAIPNGTQAVDGTKWREECYRGWLSLIEDDKMKDRKFVNVARDLVAKGWIGISKPWVWKARS